MKEQVGATVVIRTRKDLEDAHKDLEFYGGLALTKGAVLEQDLWAERGTVTSPSFISVRRNHETHIIGQEQPSG